MVIWVMLDLLFRMVWVFGSEYFFVKSFFGFVDLYYRFEIVFYGKEGDEMLEGDLDDFFMMYLNLIE